MPAQQRLRGDEQATAALRREQAAHRGEQRTIARAQLRALDLPAQHVELMTQDEQLDVLVLGGSAAEDQQP
jgi:hypothetical protein